MAPTSRLGHSIPCSALAAWPALHPVAFPPPGLCCLFTPPSSLGCTTTGQKSPAAWVWGWPCWAGPARSRLSGCLACTEAGPVADTLFPTRGTPMRPAAAWLRDAPCRPREHEHPVQPRPGRLRFGSESPFCAAHSPCHLPRDPSFPSGHTRPGADLVRLPLPVSPPPLSEGRMGRTPAPTAPWPSSLRPLPLSSPAPERP